MEIIDKESIDVPLLDKVEDDIDDPDYIIDNIKCVKYKINDGYKVKIIATNSNIIPKKHTFNKNKKMWITGDYLVVVMLDTIKNMRKDNIRLQKEVDNLKREISLIKN